MDQTKKKTAREEGISLFAAANSGRGFVSFYDGVFDRPELSRRYILKGGPGTGKSGFMRRIAACAEERGRGVRYYRCSSDPDSLDGIVVDDRLAVLDGTAPHAVEPKFPGARDELVNLGAFWDSEALLARYGEIEALDKQKSACYAKAYRYLSAATELEELNGEIVRPYVLWDKMRAAAHRILRSLPEGEGFDLLPGLQSAIGMRGRVRLDSYERMAGCLYAVDDCYGIGAMFLSCLIDEAMKKRQPISVSYEPLMPDRPDGVFLRSLGDCFLCGASGETLPDGRIRMRRFLNPDFPPDSKARIRMNRRLSEAMILEAETTLSEAGRVHGRLEEIYGACMDFSLLDTFTKEFCQRIC